MPSRLPVFPSALLVGAALVAVPVGAQITPSPALADGIMTVRDIDYVPRAEYADDLDRLDVFMPESADHVPVVVFFHGGALTFGSKASGEDMARRIVPEGIGVVSANYRLSPGVMHPAHVQDAAAAVAWVIANIERYGGDPSNVYVSGHSAGAYLATLIGVDDTYLAAHGLDRSAVRGFIPIAAFLYVEETAPTRDKSVWGTDPAAWLAASVSPHIGPGKDRFLLIYADGDDAWRREQNDRFARELLAAGSRDIRVVEVPNRTHSSLMTAMTDADDRIGPLIVDFVRERSTPPTWAARSDTGQR